MALIRCFFPVVLMPALAAGCSQSLFDANPGGGGNPPDARDGIDDPDGSTGVVPDAMIHATCPEPCVGDAVADFATDQSVGDWSYRELLPVPDFVPPPGEPDYPPQRELEIMTYGPLGTSGLSAWTGTGDPAPAIASCTSDVTDERCEGVVQRLLLLPTTEAREAHHPALNWLSRETGIYRVSVDWRMSGKATPGAPGAMLLARNQEWDSLHYQPYASSTDVATFELEVDALQGDLISLVALAKDSSSAPQGVNVFITDRRRNDQCQMAVRFLGGSTTGRYTDECSPGGSLVEAGTTNTVLDNDRPPGAIGLPRVFGSGSYLLYDGSSPNDYSGSWTVQFWATLEAPANREWLLYDIDCNERGGVSVSTDGTSMSFAVASLDGETDYCGGAPGPHEISFPFAPAAETWHFYRMVRDKDKGTLTVCVDGQKRGERALPADTEIGAATPLYVGHNPALPGAGFQGKLTDLRVYSRALPCTLQPDP